MTEKCICGYKNRGRNHNNGSHHKKWWNSLRKEDKELYKESYAPHPEEQDN